MEAEDRNRFYNSFLRDKNADLRKKSTEIRTYSYELRINNKLKVKNALLKRSYS